MADPAFFAKPTPISIGDIAALTGAGISETVDPARLIDGVAPIDRAGPGDLTFAGRAPFLAHAAATRAGACFCTNRHAASIAPGTIRLITPDPQRAFVRVTAHLYPDSLRPQGITGETGISTAAHVAPTARIEAGAIVEAGAVVGAGAEIGRGTIIGPGAAIGPGVRIGRGCSIGAGATITHCFMGDRVIIHPGVRIGQDGFGFVSGAGGHLKVPQIGRVLIQDDVEIGAGTAIDRGGASDTVIGEGTKIDNLVQIAHNVRVGRHCLIAGQVGIAGSATLGDFVALGGQVGISSHVTIGAGVQVAGASSVHWNVPAGAKLAGSPARPLRQWLREAVRTQRPGMGGDAGEGHGVPDTGGAP